MHAEELLFRTFYRALKARVMEHANPVPIQVIRRDTVERADDRGQSHATRAWHLGPSLLYKSGETPWRPRDLPENTCFVGISFHHLKRRSGGLVYASLAQAVSTEFEPFAETDVRRAVSMAIDREALVQGVYLGFAEPSTTGMSRVYLADSSGLSTFEHDPEQAQSLFEEAGVTDLSFTITASPTRPGAHAESLAVQIQSMLSDVGVNAEVDVVPGATEFSDAFFAGEYEAMVYLEPPALGDPFYSANLYNTTASFQNTFGYSNTEYDQLAAQIEQTPPGDERQEFISQISDLIVDDVPMVYLVERSYNHAFAQGISGYMNTPHGSLLTYQLTKQ